MNDFQKGAWSTTGWGEEWYTHPRILIKFEFYTSTWEQEDLALAPIRMKYYFPFQYELKFRKTSMQRGRETKRRFGRSICERNGPKPEKTGGEQIRMRNSLGMLKGVRKVRTGTREWK